MNTPPKFTGQSLTLRNTLTINSIFNLTNSIKDYANAMLHDMVLLNISVEPRQLKHFSSQK